MFDKFKDECGVFGVYGHSEASKLTYLGLYSLQHRGQESAGIASADGERVRVVKKMGYVNEIFDEGTLSTLPGHIAIGHTRYSTAGESKLSNAQPILIDCVHGQVGICHNGNIVNANEVRDRLVRAGSIFQTNSDTEVVLHLYARSQAGSVEDAIVESITQLTGAFSFALITKDSMIAVRDPHGFRPLALGKLGDGWAVTSETCGLDLIGATYVRDVEPGEIGLAARHDRQHDELGHVVRAQCLHRLIKRADLVGRRLHDDLHFRIALHRALPAVDRGHGRQHVHAGGEPRFDHGSGKQLGLLFIGDGGHHDAHIDHSFYHVYCPNDDLNQPSR